MAKVTFKEELCKGCELCINFCPKKCLGLAEHFNAQGFRPAEMKKPDECIGCAFCARMCPDVVIEVHK